MVVPYLETEPVVDAMATIGAEVHDSSCKTPWLPDVPAALQAAMAAAKQALPACKLESDRIPSPEDIELPLPAAEVEKLAGGSEYMAEWWEKGGVSRFMEARGMKHLQDRLGGLVIVGHHCARFLMPRVVNARVFQAMACTITVAFLADDLCFDEDMPAFRPGDVHRGDPDKARAFVRAWCNALREGGDPNPKEVGNESEDVASENVASEDVARLLAWASSSGRELRALSTPECFHAVVEDFVEFAEACLALQRDGEGERRYARDLDSYSLPRAYTGAVMPVCIMVEIALQVFLPPHVRAHPGIRKLQFAVALQVDFLNDIFSYNRDVVAAADTGTAVYNVVAVVMESEGLEPVQALRRAVEVVNSYTRAFLEAEAELPAAWGSPAIDSAVRRYVLGLKQMVSGHIFYCTSCLPHRYWWPHLPPSHAPPAIPS
uniref:Terpine synthase-like protein MTPSL3 n=1 Tax=Anthoceros agrestis TaxID=41834 RepID=A0A2P1ED54_9EMBR|nr:terpine synthase-like protein MTPSL3 [Anthoceros agrestis]